MYSMFITISIAEVGIYAFETRNKATMSPNRIIIISKFFLFEYALSSWNLFQLFSSYFIRKRLGLKTPSPAFSIVHAHIITRTEISSWYTFDVTPEIVDANESAI